MALMIYQDGRYTERENARFSPFDPALQCGFTLFETVRIHPGAKTFRLDAHPDVAAQLERRLRQFADEVG